MHKRYRWSLWLVAMLVVVMALPAMARTNIVTQGALENDHPFFWDQNAEGGDLIWASDAAHDGVRSLKIVKTATDNEASWITRNQATTYWNSMSNTTYTFTFWAKTDGVNTAPADDAAKAGIVWHFEDADGEPVINDVFQAVDQSAAATDWTEYTIQFALPAAPAKATAEFIMGADATGTVWVDDFNLASDPWTAGFFGDDLETPVGWMNWHADDTVVEYTDAEAHTGTRSVKFSTEGGENESVFYSIPYAAEPTTDYIVGGWVKIDAINAADSLHPTAAIGQKLNDRANICFFFHRGDDLENSWDVTGGDQFINFDQTTESTEGWVKYWALVTSPEDASGFSMRARLNNDVVGTLYFDDFFCYEVEAGEDVMNNGDLETATPFFWNEDGEGDLTWDMEEFQNGNRSLKVAKTAAGSALGWKTDDQTTKYWNNMDATTYTFTFWAKTDGVNTDPADDAAKIGATWTFLDADGEPVINNVFQAIDQSAAATDWTEYTVQFALPNVPAEAYCTVGMNADATGTVWFDHFNLASDPWTAGFFGDGVDTPAGWMNWHNDTDHADYFNAGEEAHSGEYVVRMASEGGTDESVFYSEPATVTPNMWYEFSVWVKTADIAPLNAAYYPSAVMGEKKNDRAALCFFFHRGDDLDNSWEVTGGDQFAYVQQVEATEEWTLYRGAALAPEDASGASLRARFNNDVTGELWFDDFQIRPLELQEVSVDEGDFGQGTVAVLPTSIILNQNYPNPFNSATKISYVLPSNGEVSLTVFDVLGREVAHLVDGTQSAGQHTIHFDASHLSAGVYFYRLNSVDGTAVRKMLYVK